MTMTFGLNIALGFVEFTYSALRYIKIFVKISRTSEVYFNKWNVLKQVRRFGLFQRHWSL